MVSKMAILTGTIPPRSGKQFDFVKDRLNALIRDDHVVNDVG